MFPLPDRIGRYEIKTLIGAGGMGSLYLARDTNPNTNRLVALKLLNANLDSGDLRQRFAREARALAALNHPNIVDIYDSGEFQGSPFIVMEYVRGETLAEKIKRQAPMSLAQKLKLMVELCSGLGHAHEAGIIHRDIKPANLMVDAHGRLKILDFGIARVSEGSLTRAGLQMTQVNVRIGTPGYMSPEQIEGGEIDRRSDVFAVGAVCYELVSYREAFKGTTTRQIENSVLQSQPVRLTSLIDGLDPEIEAIISRALEKDPAQRYQDTGTLEEALERQRWRLGPLETPTPVHRSTPPPATPNPGRKSHDARAEAAYLRALGVYEEGAHDAARRFAIEALAEEPDHEGARAFIERLGPNRWPPAPPPSVPPRTMPATAPRTASEGFESETMAPTVLNPATPSKRDAVPWRNRYGRGIQVAAILVAVAGVVGTALLVGFWMWPSGQVLTITKPMGGTVSGGGIRCGPNSTDCSAKIAKGTIVELRPEPDAGFVFEAFTGDCAPGGWTTMNASRTCGATFAPIPASPPQRVHMLTIAPPVGGTVLGAGIQCGTLGSECSASLPEGEEIKLKAYADADYTFRGFTGECARTGETVMSEPRTCGATFLRDRAVSPPPAASVSSAPAAGSKSEPRIVTPDPVANLPTPTTPNPEPTTPDVVTGKKLPSPMDPQTLAKAEIQKVLDEYRAAYRDLDPVALRRVYPAAPNAIDRQLKGFKSLDYVFNGPVEFIEVDPALGTATVKAVAKLTPQALVGSAKAFERRDLFKLQRQQNGDWVIKELSFPAK